MGHPMAHRLVEAGYRLLAFDTNVEAVRRFAASNDCEQPASLAALAAGSDRVITMLPDGGIVHEVILGADGVADHLKQGAVIIDMSSSSPVGTRRLGAELAARGIPLVDAPVSGGVVRAVDGTLSIMAGGDADVVQRCRDVLEVFGKVFCTGASGSGHAMKALNNYLSAATLAVSTEAILAGSRFGLDPGVMIEVLNNSTGRSNSTEHKFPAFILPRKFNSGFALGLMAKDLRLALELAHDTGAPASLLERCSALWSEAEAELGFRADNTDIYRYLESRVRD